MNTQECIEVLDDILAEYMKGKGNIKKIKALIMAVKCLLQNEWIPVTEGLPKEEGWYLISMGDEWADGNYPFGKVVTKDRIYPSNVRLSEFKDGSFSHGMVAAWKKEPIPYYGGKK